MNKFWITFLILCSASTLYFNDVSAEIIEYELTNHPTINIEDPLSCHQITLKGTTCTHYTSIDSKVVNISYIIKIKTPISECQVHLSIQDKDGFEIVRETISSVTKGYTGSLKGNFSLKPSQYQKISGAELYFTVKPK